MTSRVNELTALQQAAEEEIHQLRQRNDRLTDHINQLQQQVIQSIHSSVHPSLIMLKQPLKVKNT